jgi:hypothetical protein
MLTELAPNSERATAVITSHLESGENFDGAIVIGVYPENETEIWIESQGTRIAVMCGDVDSLCKQLKRAKKIALEAGNADR